MEDMSGKMIYPSDVTAVTTALREALRVFEAMQQGIAVMTAGQLADLLQSHRQALVTMDALSS